MRTLAALPLRRRPAFFDRAIPKQWIDCGLNQPCGLVFPDTHNDEGDEDEQKDASHDVDLFTYFSRIVASDLRWPGHLFIPPYAH